MKRSLTYKLAILGCSSLGTLSAAFANTASSHEEVTMYDPFPEITNVACEADERPYFFFVQNTGDEDIEIESFDILIDDDDSYPLNDDIVRIDQSEVPFPYNACSEETDYAPDELCVIAVIVDPTEITCPVHPIVQDGEIERRLKVVLEAGSQAFVESPIDLDVTVLGTVEEYSVMANWVYADSSCFDPDANAEVACADDVDTTAGITQVSLDVGIIDFIGDPDDILYHDGAELIETYENQNFGPYFELPNQNVGGFADAEQAYETLRAAAFDYDDADECVGPQLEISGDVEIGPGIYCLVDERDHDDDYFVVDGTVTFRGNRDSLFVFVMPSLIDGDDVEDEVELEIEPFADFDLTTVAGRVDSDNIIWVGADLITFHSTTTMVGTFLTKGTIVAEGSDVSLLDSEPVGPAIVKGRFIGLDGDDDFQSYVILNGNTLTD